MTIPITDETGIIPVNQDSRLQIKTNNSAYTHASRGREGRFLFVILQNPV